MNPCDTCPECSGCRAHDPWRGVDEERSCDIGRRCSCPASVREHGGLTTREQQALVHDRHADAAFSVLLGIMQRPETRERVVALSRDRLLGIGFDEYGDAMFRQGFAELLTETDEELADAVNRMVAGLERIFGNVHGAVLELLNLQAVAR